MKAALIGATLTGWMLLSSPVDAEVYTSITNTSHENSTYIVRVPVKLNNAGVTAATFTLNSRRRIIISFSAECKVGIEGADARVTIEIDGKEVAPTADAAYTVFCNTAFYGMHSITVSKRLAAGKHRVRLILDSNAAHFAYLRNSSLVIFD